MKIKELETNDYFTIPQLADILNISRIAVYKKVKKGEIKAKKFGHIYIIPKSYVSEIFRHTLSPHWKRRIKSAVHKAVKEYGEVLIKLGNE